MAKSRKLPRELSDLAIFLTTKEGRAILWRQLEDAGIWRSVFNTDHATMAFLEGRRNLGLKLWVNIQEASFDRFLDMIKENSGGGRNGNDPGNDGNVDSPGDESDD